MLSLWALGALLGLWTTVHAQDALPAPELAEPAEESAEERVSRERRTGILSGEYPFLCGACSNWGLASLWTNSIVTCHVK